MGSFPNRSISTLHIRKHHAPNTKRINKIIQEGILKINGDDAANFCELELLLMIGDRRVNRNNGVPIMVERGVIHHHDMALHAVSWASIKGRTLKAKANGRTGKLAIRGVEEQPAGAKVSGGAAQAVVLGDGRGGVLEGGVTAGDW